MSLHFGITQQCMYPIHQCYQCILGKLGKVLFKPRWSSNTACLADYVEGEPLSLLHEEQEFVHDPTIVGNVPIVGVIKGQHGAPELPVYSDMLIPQRPFLLFSARTAWNQLSAK